MKDNKYQIKISSASFPDEFCSDAEKASDDFGLKVAKAIEYQWFKRDGADSLFYSRWNEFHKRRLYARAEQPISKYKDELSVDGDLSHINLDFTPIAIGPKFVDIVTNGMSDRLFYPKAVATDAMSQQKRNQFQDMVEGQMVSKELLSKIKERTGVETFTMDPDDLPQNGEELSIYMNMNYKPAAEIAEEEAIREVFADNDFDEVRRMYDYDKVVLGVGFMKHDFLEGKGVDIQYCDPAEMVWSYSEDPYFRDSFYFGEVKVIPTNELRKIDPSLSEDKLAEISRRSQSWYDWNKMGRYYDDEIFNGNTSCVMYFDYKTTQNVTYKKEVKETGNLKMVEKDDSFNPPEEMMEEGRFEKVQKTIDVWYQGCYVLGTDILIQWKKMDNMVRPKSSFQKAMPRFIGSAPRMYKGRIDSLVNRMIPFLDAIQITHLKIQQVQSRVVPDGIFIDADGINEVDLGTGAAYNPEDALRLYFQTGSIIGRSFTQDGEFNHAKIPVQEIQHSSGGSKIQTLIMLFNQYLDGIRLVTGLNEARDGSDPDPRSLVGLQKIAALNSNTATRHLLDSALYNTKQMAECVSLRISDIIQYSDMAEAFANKVGKHNMQILHAFKDLYLCDFGIHIEMSPDEEEKAKLEENIQMALSKGDINLEDAIDIREINNVKFANQLLKFKRVKKQEHDDQMAMQQQQMQMQTQMQSQQMAAQMAQQKIQMETQGKLQIKQAEIQGEMARMEQEAALKEKLMGIEFDYNMKLKGIDAQTLQDREKAKEDEKTKRQDRNNSQQSKLIEQRKKDLPPVDFESNEDSLDGFELGSFEPR